MLLPTSSSRVLLRENFLLFFPWCIFSYFCIRRGKNWVKKRYSFPLSFDIILSLFTSAYLEEKLDIFLPLPHLGGKKYYIFSPVGYLLGNYCFVPFFSFSFFAVRVVFSIFFPPLALRPYFPPPRGGGYFQIYRPL